MDKSAEKKLRFGAGNDLNATVFDPTKLFGHKRMANWLMGKEIYPITMELGPAGPGNCPHKCNFCMHGSYYDTKAMMSFDLYKKIVDELTSFDGKNPSENPSDDISTRGMIFSSSGEPTSNPEINNFITYTKEKGMEVALITNGWGWQHRKGLMEIVLDNVSWTRTSVNAGSYETREKIHGVNDYNELIGALTVLSRKKKDRKSKCNIGAQIVVSEDNWKEIKKFVGDIEGTGVDYVQIKPVVYHPLDNKKQLDLQFWQHALIEGNLAKEIYENDAFKVYVKYDQFADIIEEDYGRKYKKCLANFFPIIEADGSVFYCSQTRGMPEFELGNLNKQSFKEIWEGERRKKVNNSIDVNKCQPICRCHWHNKALSFIREKASAFT